MLEHWNTVGLRKVRPGWKTLYFHEKLKSESWKCIRKKWQTQYVVTLGWSRDLSHFGGETQFRETFICGALSGESPFPRNGLVVVTEQVIDSPMMESRLSWGTRRRRLWPLLKSRLGDWSHHEVFSGDSSCLAQVRSLQIVNSKLMIMMIVQENCWSNIWQKGAVQIDQIYLFPFGVGSLCRRFYSWEEKWFWNRNPRIHSFSLLIRLAVDFKPRKYLSMSFAWFLAQFLKTIRNVCRLERRKVNLGGAVHVCKHLQILLFSRSINLTVYLC